MSTKFGWVVHNMERSPDSGEVSVVHWRCNGTDGDVSGTTYGTHSLPPAPEGGDFVAFEDVTQDMVLGWCFSSGLSRAEKEDLVQSQIDAQRTPQRVKGTPWGSTSQL